MKDGGEEADRIASGIRKHEETGRESSMGAASWNEPAEGRADVMLICR